MDAEPVMLSPHGLRPVGDLVLQDQVGQAKFAPQADMSGADAAWISVLLASFQVGANCDWRTFLSDHGLARHFEEIKYG